MSEDVIATITDALSTSQVFSEVWLVGSSVRSSMIKGNLDFLVTCRQGDLEHRQLIESCLTGRLDFTEAVYSDDSIILMRSTNRVGIAVTGRNSFYAQLREYASGHNLYGQMRVWAPGAWIPEALCADVADARILLDPQGRAEFAQRSLQQYPTAMAEAIIALCREEIALKVPRLDFQSEPVTQAALTSDIALALTRLAFAGERVYLQGFHRLDKQAARLGPVGEELLQLARRISIVSAQPELLPELQKEVSHAVTVN